jgi:hypothetical protein
MITVIQQTPTVVSRGRGSVVYSRLLLTLEVRAAAEYADGII